MSRSPKQSPEEMRLATLARVFGEHPDNEVAWKKLCEAALDYARSKGLGGGVQRPVATATVDSSSWSGNGWDAWVREMARRGAGVRPAGKQKTEQVKQARRQAETAADVVRRREEEQRRRDEQERQANNDFKRDAKEPGTKDDEYPF